MSVVLLRLTNERLRRLGWRLFTGAQFTVTVPEGLIRPHRRSRVLLLTAETGKLDWDGDALDIDPSGVPSLIAVARLRGAGRPSTTDNRVQVADSHMLDPPLHIRDLVRRMPPADRPTVRQAAEAVGAELDDPLGAEVLSRLVSLRPELSEVVERLARFAQLVIEGEEAPVIAMERDAVKLALALAGFSLDDTDRLNPDALGGYLARLEYPPREESLSGYDAIRFPDWEPLPGTRTDWTEFTDGKHYIRVGNVNNTKLEHVLGVDLIYRHLNNDTFVLVQYKKMTRSGPSDWGYRPDDQLEAELERMRTVDGQGEQADDDPQSWRLFPKGCFIKLLRPPNYVDPISDRLLGGIYLPVPYFDAVRAHGTAAGARGGEWLGYKTVDRYLTTDLFVDLVRQRWIGTLGVSTHAIQLLVDAAVGERHSVIIAEDLGEQTGSERRARRQPI